MFLHVGDYIEDAEKHIPKRYDLRIREVREVFEMSGREDTEIVRNSFLLGFEKAYQAAKVGKLDFQQKRR